MKKPFFYLVIIFLSIFTACNKIERSGLGPGESAPKFSLPDLNGKIQNLADYRGKFILLNFWASWCGPCVEETPALNNLYLKFKDQNFVVLAVAVDDDLEDIKAFQEKNKLEFPILIDNSSLLNQLYKLTGVPESFLIDPEGKMILFQDFESQNPSVRMVGPRQWDSGEAMRSFGGLLAK